MTVKQRQPIQSPAEITEFVRDTARRVIESAEADLAVHGLKVGAIVDYRVPYRNGGRYRITRINWGDAAHPFLFFYGLKLRADGTFGTFEHSLSGPEHLRVVGHG